MPVSGFPPQNGFAQRFFCLLLVPRSATAMWSGFCRSARTAWPVFDSRGYSGEQ